MLAFVVIILVAFFTTSMAIWGRTERSQGVISEEDEKFIDGIKTVRLFFVLMVMIGAPIYMSGEVSIMNSIAIGSVLAGLVLWVEGKIKK